MCYHLSLFKDLRQLEARFGASFEDPGAYEPSYHKAAFFSPLHPVITGSEPDRIRMLEWGLIPGWVKDAAQARQVRKGTYNAKAETIFKKPSFRSPIMQRRCLVLADGFFEWQHAGTRKYPYYIRLKSRGPFALAGIWDEWNFGGSVKQTFSIITTEANPMLARIHNTKKRMPVMLRRKDERRWLEEGLAPETIGRMLSAYDQDEMEAYTVLGPVASGKGPGVIAPFDYTGLDDGQRLLF